MPAGTALERHITTDTVVLEVRSPADKPDERVGWDDRYGVKEILVADPIEHTIRCWSRTGTGHLVLPDLSDMYGVDLRERAAQIWWR